MKGLCLLRLSLPQREEAGNKGKRLKGFPHIPEGFSFFLSSKVLGLVQCLALGLKRKTSQLCFWNRPLEGGKVTLAQLRPSQRRCSHVVSRTTDPLHDWEANQKPT